MISKVRHNLGKYINNVLSPETTLKDVIECLTKTGIGIACVVSEDRRLLGIVVDSDIRRALLAAVPMTTIVTAVMNRTPFVMSDQCSEEELTNSFRKHCRAYVPIVDAEDRLVGLECLSDYVTAKRTSAHAVVIMAGGRGTRLRPLTENCPKPMVPLGSKPILEHNLEYLVGFGLHKFFFSVNYLGEQIQQYFGDGSKWGVNIEYILEPEAMGTAGSLSFLDPNKFDKPFIVMNGDLLTRLNMHALLESHLSDRNCATMCVREYDFQVPYGVVNIEGNQLVDIIEKPVHRFFVNAGIYVLEPRVLHELKKFVYCDMTDLLSKLQKEKPGSVGCFPIQEYWLDIGKMEDYQRALKEYDQHGR